MFALEEHCLAAFLRRPEFLTQASAVLEDLELAPVGQDDFERAENRALLDAWLRFEGGQDWQAWVDALPQLLQLHLDFLLERGLDTEELVGQDAERDIERRILELRRRRIDRDCSEPEDAADGGTGPGRCQSQRVWPGYANADD